MPETHRLKRRRGRGGTNFKWLSCNTIPALNDFHPIHKIHVLVSVLNLGHDHSSGRGVKLEEGKIVHLYLIKGYDCNSFRVKKKYKSGPCFIKIHSIIHACANKGRIINREFHYYSAITCGLPARPIICSMSASLYSSQEPATYCMVDLITTRCAGRFTPMARVLVVTYKSKIRPQA